MPFSLSDLKEKRALVDQGPWLCDVPGLPPGCADIRCLGTEDTSVAEGITRPNAIGIVAMHNAGDVLIEVVGAALAWQASLEERKQFGARAYYEDPFSILTLERRSTRAKLDAQIRDRAAALREALSKVLP